MLRKGGSVVQWITHWTSKICYGKFNLYSEVIYEKNRNMGNVYNIQAFIVRKWNKQNSIKSK